MEELLSFIAGKMNQHEIPYEFGEWSSEVKYPYCVGTFSANDYRFEDNCISGTLTVDIWSRESKLQAVQTADRIAEIFRDLQEVSGGSAFYIRFMNADAIPSGEMDLFRISMKLFCSKWKGE